MVVVAPEGPWLPLLLPEDEEEDEVEGAVAVLLEDPEDDEDPDEVVGALALPPLGGECVGEGELELGGEGELVLGVRDSVMGPAVVARVLERVNCCVPAKLPEGPWLRVSVTACPARHAEGSDHKSS